jgi:hypothetical protein
MLFRKNLFLLILFIFSFTLYGRGFSQNISEMIGEVKFVNAQGGGGYYALIAGGKQYALINLPKQQGKIQEGKYKITGMPTMDVKDDLFTGPIPFQVTHMEYMGPSAQSNQNGTIELTGPVFFYNYGGVSTYVLDVAGPNNTHTYYTLVNIPAGQISDGNYKVRGVTNSSLKSPSGFGTPLQISKIEPANGTQQPGQKDNKDKNKEQQYTGMILFRPVGNVGGIGYYMLQTQDNNQYALIDLPQEEGKIPPGYYNVKGAITPEAPNPYGINIPLMHITDIKLIREMPGMNSNTMDMFNVNNDDEEEEESTE